MRDVADREFVRCVLEEIRAGESMTVKVTAATARALRAALTEDEADRCEILVYETHPRAPPSETPDGKET